jgi:hypothetical protein
MKVPFQVWKAQSKLSFIASKSLRDKNEPAFSSRSIDINRHDVTQAIGSNPIQDIVEESNFPAKMNKPSDNALASVTNAPKLSYVKEQDRF